MLEINTTLKLSGFFHQVDFNAENELVVVFGPSGAGKSLALNIIAGLITPDSGTVKIGNRVFFDSANRVNLPVQKRRVGYVFQDYALFPHMSVTDNIAFGLPRLPRYEIVKRVREMLKLMRLERLGESFPGQISGGQKQRVALARALIMEPSVLLLDEPFSSLHSAVREKLRHDLLNIKNRYEIPIIFVTHDLEEAYVLADQIVVFNQGRVLQAGARDDVFYRPNQRTVARFVGAKNIFSGRVGEIAGDLCKIEAPHFSVTAPVNIDINVGDTVDFCIRPEDILFVRPDRDLSEKKGENVLFGKIVAAACRGAVHQLEFKLNGGNQSEHAFDFTIRLPNHAYQRLGLTVGGEARISLKQPAIHLLSTKEISA